MLSLTASYFFLKLWLPNFILYVCISKYIIFFFFFSFQKVYGQFKHFLYTLFLTWPRRYDYTKFGQLTSHDCSILHPLISPRLLQRHKENVQTNLQYSMKAETETLQILWYKKINYFTWTTAACKIAATDVTFGQNWVRVTRFVVSWESRGYVVLCAGLQWSATSCVQNPARPSGVLLSQNCQWKWTIFKPTHIKRICAIETVSNFTFYHIRRNLYEK